MLGVKKSEVKLTEKLTAISLQITVYCSSSSCSFIITTSITELKDLSEFSSTSFELYCQQFNYCEWHFWNKKIVISLSMSVGYQYNEGDLNNANQVLLF